MKILNGQKLAGYIQQKQAHQVRSLIQSKNIQPKLAIIRTNPDPVVDKYMELKKQYGQEVGIDVEVFDVKQEQAKAKIEALNKDITVQGIIVQIPLPDPSQTDEILNTVAANKDVDGLAEKSNFDPATPIAINWLLAGYNIDLKEKNLVVVGNGRLVGKPLAKIWEKSGLSVDVVDRQTKDLNSHTEKADVLVCATGVPGLVNASMVKPNAVIIDAGVATDSNGLVGDVDPDIRELPDVTITPEKGGVGPLTVCALFENVIRSAES